MSVHQGQQKIKYAAFNCNSTNFTSWLDVSNVIEFTGAIIDLLTDILAAQIRRLVLIAFLDVLYYTIGPYCLLPIGDAPEI